MASLKPEEAHLLKWRSTEVFRWRCGGIFGSRIIIERQEVRLRAHYHGDIPYQTEHHRWRRVTFDMVHSVAINGNGAARG